MKTISRPVFKPVSLMTIKTCFYQYTRSNINISRSVSINIPGPVSILRPVSINIPGPISISRPVSIHIPGPISISRPVFECLTGLVLYTKTCFYHKNMSLLCS